MPVASGVTMIWAGTHAGVPAGWARATDGDDNYLKSPALSTDGGGTGGSASHNHAVTTHTHTQNSHNHPMKSASISGTTTIGLGITSAATSTHTHTTATSSSATATNQNGTFTVGTTSNDPPYYEIIYIKSNGTADIPDDVIGFWDTSTVPTNWSECNGSSGTNPDLRNRFLVGASTGADAGGTGGSSDAHTHTPTSAHGHTQNSHSHGRARSSVPTGTAAGGSGLTSIATGSHTHDVTLASATATNNTTIPTFQNADGQPDFKKLLCIQNTSGGSVSPFAGLIALWPALEADIPPRWERYSGMDDLFLKGANTTGEIGNTGGSDQHTHTGNAHTHTQVKHNHTGSGAAGRSFFGNLLGITGVATGTHTHNWTIGKTVAVNQNTTVGANNNTSEANYPAYYEQIFIQFINRVPLYYQTYTP